MLSETTIHHHWHAVTPDDVYRRLETRREGLSAEEVTERRALFGENTLPEGKRDGVLLVYLRQFTSPLIYLLLAAAIVSLIIGEWTDALFIFTVLQINAIIGAIQEWKAETSAQSLKQLIQNWVVAEREGIRCQINSTELVPGDLVHLESGAKVPADMRLVEATDLKIDESLLTGESLPANKEAGVVLADETTVGDRRNMAFAGSTVLTGRALGIVTQTAIHTEVGRIAQALVSTESAKPPLILRLEKFIKVVGSLVVLAVILLGVAQFLKGMALAEIFFISVALAVSAIPEGLPVAITIALSVSSARMAKKNVIVRSLPAVEGLGACTLIASDKTGTLTCNQLTAKKVFLPGYGLVDIGGEGYHPEGEIVLEGQAMQTAARDLAVSAALCNEATFRPAKEGGYAHFGDTVDVAFLVLAAKMGIDRETLIVDHPEHAFIPFEASNRYAASLNADQSGSTLHVKGAAEVILPMCDNIDRGAMLHEAEELAHAGYRVLAVAHGHHRDAPQNIDPHQLKRMKFLGFVGLIDPVRPEVPAAVKECQAAGIDVHMVTGDHPGTALAIAKQLGTATERNQVMTGSELADLMSDPADADAAMAETKVFARVEPVQKLDIVQAAQRQGHFVAVTGDGVNDAPALRTAHIGVAMGKDGTDAARGAADLILTDDNFVSIVAGIREGRIAYDNVRKVVYLLVSTGASEIVLFVLAILKGLPLPLFAVQLLWLNLVTNGLQHVGLAFEKGEPGVLARKPRPPSQPIFDRRMIEQVILSGAFIGLGAFVFFDWALSAGWTEAQARNMLLLLMVCFENAHVFNCRSETRSVTQMPLSSNWLLVGLTAAAQGIHIAALYIPGVNTVLQVEPLPPEAWATVVPIALGLVLMMETYKAYARWFDAR